MSYLDYLPIQLAIDRIQNAFHYEEHHVGTFMATVLPLYFPAAKGWAITPEQTQANKKKPDFIVESSSPETPELAIHLAVELKKLGKENFPGILRQLEKAISDTVQRTDDYTIFAIAQRGMDIGFFEYHHLEDELENTGVGHYHGFVPMTAPYPHHPTIQLPEDVKTFKGYPQPCLFDIVKHKEYVHRFLSIMEKEVPRNTM